MSNSKFDVIVVGGGHAGIEAALAVAKMGSRCALVTHDRTEIGRMPCNPAIGGLGKGQLVRELDVLGGQMGVATDETGIQFRILNLKKGPAVQSPRAQVDKIAYQDSMVECTSTQDGLTIIEGDAASLLTEHKTGDDRPRVTGVKLGNGKDVFGSRVVLCTGTFLKGLMHIGERKTIGGREGAPSSEGMSESLRSLGFKLKRLKTGTPARLCRDSINYSALSVQPGDENPRPFSFRTRDFNPVQIDCHMTYTNEQTHEIIRQSLGRSPLYVGIIEGQGPRYCPSIEDKVVRFAEKTRHLLFLEPEGRDSQEFYINGLSTSLPDDVQEKVVKSIVGLEGAKILRYGYAIEYDSVPSWQISRSLETKVVRGLYLAGQLLGTSGYEEAAAQGFVAGVNAVLDIEKKNPISLGRDEAYIGVMVDDLVTKEINEPYRMFTSRAEHRLFLRCDNAENRLFEVSQNLGILPAWALEQLKTRSEVLHEVGNLLKKAGLFVSNSSARVGAFEYLKFPGSTLAGLLEKIKENDTVYNDIECEYSKLRNMAGGERVLADFCFQLENDIKYEGYIAKQNRLLKNRGHLDNLSLPPDLDYSKMVALSIEARQKLAKVRPENLGQAERIDGVRAGDLAVLAVIVKKEKEQKARDAKADCAGKSPNRGQEDV